MVGHKNLQLKGDTIPRGLLPLEILFNNDVLASKPMASEMNKQVEYCNIVSEDEP